MKKNILIIEDNQDVRENLAELLVLSNYSVQTADNGKAGIKLAMEERPDLIICDIMMPELDGYGVLKVLNNNPNLATIPFIFLTAKVEKSDFRRGMMLGATDYITKPFDDQELMEVVEIRLKKNANLSPANESSMLGLQDVDLTKFKSKIKELSEGREIRSYRKRELVFEEAQNSRYIYFVVSGKIRTYIVNDTGKEFSTQIYTNGEVFGIVDLINDRPYSKYAAAIEDSKLALIPSSAFMDLVNKDKEVQFSLIKLLASYYNNHELALVHQAYSSVRKKVANSLVYFFEKNNGNHKFHVLREDLATIAGTAKETLIRTLTDFKNEGLIAIDDSDIEIKHLNGLIHMPQ